MARSTVSHTTGQKPRRKDVADMAQQPTSHEELEEHEDHGHSLAAWVGVGVILLGFTLGCVAVVIANVTLFIIGAVVIVAGVIAGMGLARAGYGASARREREAELAAQQH